MPDFGEAFSRVSCRILVGFCEKTRLRLPARNKVDNTIIHRDASCHAGSIGTLASFSPTASSLGATALHSQDFPRLLPMTSPSTFSNPPPLTPPSQHASRGWGLLRQLWLLGRFPRPIGVVLLFWPCVWGALLSLSDRIESLLAAIIVLAIGAFAARAGGCVWNDISDRHIDRGVARTANRPIASGQVSVLVALIFLAGLFGVAMMVLLSLPIQTGLVVGSVLPFVALYPFAKRFFFAPQLILGLCFNWGVFVGYSLGSPSVSGAEGLLTGATWLLTDSAEASGQAGISALVAMAADWTWIDAASVRVALCLYGAGICWTLLYDTVYAIQDHRDDRLQGLKSTAILVTNLPVRGMRGVLALWGLATLLLFWLGLLSLRDESTIGLIVASCLLLCVAARWGVRLHRIDAATPQLAGQFFLREAGTGGLLTLALASRLML